MTDMPRVGPRVAFLAGAGLVALVTLVTFLPALSSPFIGWDDGRNFLANPQYRGLGRDNLRWMFTAAYDGHYMPITWLTFGVDYLLWGMNPRGYHLTSVILHVLNAVLFYVVSRRLLRAAFAWRRSAPGLTWGAASAALLFAVHPLRVESVAWITERRDVVAGALTLLTILAYLEAEERGEPGRLHAGWYWTAVGLFGLALLSKSIVVGLPIALLALDRYPLRRACGCLRLVVEKIPFVLLSLAVAVLMILIGLRRELMTGFETLGLLQRLAISAYGLAFYVWKTVIPWPLSPFYELHLTASPLAATYLLAAAATLAIFAFALAARRRWPAVLTAWIVYAVLLLPVIGLLHNGYQIVADRYSYLACLGWALLGGCGIAWCWDAKGRGAITPRLAGLVFALAAVVIASLGGLTTLQIRVWRDSETLWRHAVAFDPESAFAHFNLGLTLRDAGRPDEARAEYERALALLPERLPNAKAVFHATLGMLLHERGDVAGAEQNYRSALRYSEDNVIARTNLGVIQAQRGELQAALDSFVRALRVRPGYADACVNGWRVATLLAVSPTELRSCAQGRSERPLALSGGRGRVPHGLTVASPAGHHVTP
jgi:tetratricopeptide (TPR) repeat protein